MFMYASIRNLQGIHVQDVRRFAVAQYKGLNTLLRMAFTYTDGFKPCLPASPLHLHCASREPRPRLGPKGRHSARIGCATLSSMLDGALWTGR